MAKNTIFDRHDDPFAALSLHDLIEAREAYHVHLMRHPNVVATCLGYYRIRRTDSWPGDPKKIKGTFARQLGNSEVRPYSWPAILVFVSEWIDEGDFGKNKSYDPSDMLPPAVYLPDGRQIPICVVEAPRVAESTTAAPKVRYPLNNIGSGNPVTVEVQGERHVATVACLVTDGHTTYALTNRHVTGPEGTVIDSVLDRREQRVGISSAEQIGQIPFSTLYPGWETDATMVNADIGLIRVDDLERWTARLKGGRVMDQMIDLSSKRFPLALVGRHVRGYGAASTWMHAEIQGLFYRYKSRGGFESVADFLIGPQTPVDDAPAIPFATRPGDSGTLWLLEGSLELPSNEKRRTADLKTLHPLAVQWGADRLIADSTNGERAYVLATLLSTTCAHLNLDVVRDWNLDQHDTWGALGHFSIASSVAAALSSRVPKLKKLMENNISIISHPLETLHTGDFKGMADDAIVPMADVPDFFWKHGHQHHSRQWEGPNHFADMDQVREADKADLLKLCEDDKNVDPKVWDDFYSSVRDPLTGKVITYDHRGLLPFRVWQIFDEMIGFARDKDGESFVCAAGVLAHYVGDACQPLHISSWHHGDTTQPQHHTVHHKKDGSTTEEVFALGDKVHDAYENDMLMANRDAVLAGLARTRAVGAKEHVGNGREAALATVALMRSTFQKVPPHDLVNLFNKGGKPAERVAAMWGKYGAATIEVMKDGTHLLAVLWESAWQEGHGEDNVRSTAALKPERSMEIVAPESFVPSYKIDDIAGVLTWPGRDDNEPHAAAEAATPAPRGRAR